MQPREPDTTGPLQDAGIRPKPQVAHWIINTAANEPAQPTAAGRVRVECLEPSGRLEPKHSQKPGQRPGSRLGSNASAADVDAGAAGGIRFRTADDLADHRGGVP